MTDVPDAIVEALLPIYLDGFITGASSALLTCGPNIPEERRDEIADWLTQGISQDPALAETMREEIRERLQGADTGPKTLRLVGPPPWGASE